jgi:hypothetical protein
MMNDIKLKRVFIKEELVQLTGDCDTAIILNQMLYWQERVGQRKWDEFVKEEQTRDHEDPDKLKGGWIYKPATELAEEIMMGRTSQNTSKSLGDLVAMGYLFRRNNPEISWDRTYQYRTNLVKIIADLEKLGGHLEGFKSLQFFRENKY